MRTSRVYEIRPWPPSLKGHLFDLDDDLILQWIEFVCAKSAGLDTRRINRSSVPESRYPPFLSIHYSKPSAAAKRSATSITASRVRRVMLESTEGRLIG